MTAADEGLVYEHRLAAALAKLRKLTEISWTHLTFNPWSGCAKVDRECRFCYAERESKRWKLKIWGRKVGRQFRAEAYWRQPVRWNRIAAEHAVQILVFCASQSDVFEIHADPAVQAELDKARARLWELIEATPHLTWQLLTKRPENILSLVPARWVEQGWPANVWLGTSVGRQDGAHRIDLLVATGARVKFLSAEPLVGALDITPWVGIPGGLDWVIWGGESGGAKVDELDPQWARAIVRACVATGVPVWGKQLGAKLARRLGLVVPGGPRNGPDPELWPDELGDLRRREMPDPAAA